MGSKKTYCVELSKLINRDGYVDIPDEVTEIPARAFEANRALKAVSIHGGVKLIDDLAFAMCWNLESVKMHATHSLTIAENAFDDTKKLRKISVPYGTSDSYKFILPERLHDKIVERSQKRGLVIDKLTTLYPIIPSEIFEWEADVLWQTLVELVNEMQEKQESLLPLMQDAKNNLPTEEDLLNSESAQRAFIYYIQLRAVYAMLHWIWHILDKLCFEFAKLSNDRKDTTDIKEEIIRKLEITKSIDWSKYPNDKQEDLVKLNKVRTQYNYGDFGVVGAATLADIVHPLLAHGFQAMPCYLEEAVRVDYPIDINIDKLLNITENINLMKEHSLSF